MSDELETHQATTTLITYQKRLITHYSLLITHYSLLITHYSLLITHYSLLITHYSLLVLFVVVLEVAPEAFLRVHVEDDAGVDRQRIDVHRHRALIPIGGIDDAVNGLRLVDCVERPAWDDELGVDQLHLD